MPIIEKEIEFSIALASFKDKRVIIKSFLIHKYQFINEYYTIIESRLSLACIPSCNTRSVGSSATRKEGGSLFITLKIPRVNVYIQN